MEYEDEVIRCATQELDWSKIDNKSILITGGTGLVGKYLIHVLIKRNEMYSLSTKIFVVGRSREKFNKRLGEISGIQNVVFIEEDVKNRLVINEEIDYIIHLASNTHPGLYASEPIDTEMTNIIGTYNLLELASEKKSRFVLASSGDIYGDNLNENGVFHEDDCGYINCNTLRAGYIEGKRASEALCNAYREEKSIDFVIARFCRLYGPCMQLDDTKAVSEFILKTVEKKEIIIKSSGLQTFTYLYIYDAVSALLYLLIYGKTAEAYNVAYERNSISLRDLAQMLSRIGGNSVLFSTEYKKSKGASDFMNVILSSDKICSLGWKPVVDMESGLKRTVEMIRELFDFGE